MLDLLGEIESDLSVFHRIDDMWELDAARFFRLARRLPAYGGAVAAALSEQKDRTEPMTRAVAPKPGSPADSGVRVVGASAAELKVSDIGDLFSIGSAGA